MMVNNRGSVFRLLMWQWKNTLLFVGASTLVVLLHTVAGFEWLALPTVPVAVIGGAIGIFVSFGRTPPTTDGGREESCGGA
jgi:putative membrane protein